MERKRGTKEDIVLLPNNKLDFWRQTKVSQGSWVADAALKKLQRLVECLWTIGSHVSWVAS